MGRSIAIKTENIDGKPVEQYRIWTGNSDEWMTDWMTREELIKFLFWDRFYDFVTDFLKDEATFPHHWGRKGEMTVIVRKEEALSFGKFMQDALYSDQYEKIILTKFSEVLEKYGLSVKVMDDKEEVGYNSKEVEE